MHSVNTPPPPMPPYHPAPAPLDVIHVDDDILVISKPAGLLSVAGKTPELADCLASRARAEYTNSRIVHRLDMDTSGIMVLARNALSHKRLGIQFEKRKVSKTYIARVWEHPSEGTGHIDLPMRCDWPNRPKQMVDHEQGKSAQTNWRVMSRDTDGTARLELSPITGRSHQLRVHMKEIDHPILGDPFYAHDQARTMADRLMLHAQDISFFHPMTNEVVRYTAPCPF